jgi:hypothetical protein
MSPGHYEFLLQLQRPCILFIGKTFLELNLSAFPGEPLGRRLLGWAQQMEPFPITRHLSLDYLRYDRINRSSWTSSPQCYFFYNTKSKIPQTLSFLDIRPPRWINALLSSIIWHIDEAP